MKETGTARKKQQSATADIRRLRRNERGVLTTDQLPLANGSLRSTLALIGMIKEDSNFSELGGLQTSSMWAAAS